MKRFIQISLIFLLFVSSLLASLSFFTPQKSFADGTYANIGTADAADGGPDALNFSQGRVWTIDKFGKYIWLTEARNSDHHWAWSNDSGSTWTQGSESYAFLARGSVAYDSVNDILHVIWVAQGSDSSGGVIYRRYSITRDGSHNITSIQRVDTSVNLQLDYTNASASTEEPIALWVNDGSTYGELVAVWAKNAMSGPVSEVRASMRKLSNTNADGTAGNWLPLDGAADTFSTDPPQVPADKVLSRASATINAAAGIRGGSGSKSNDMYVFPAVSSGSNSNLYSYRASWNSSNKDWSNGWQSPVTVGSINDQAGGYSQKEQLVSRPVLDSINDRLYIGWARWKDNTFGDTWSFAYLDSSDTPSATFDAYSANGTHAYAPTGDIAFDATTGLIYVSYVESTTNGTNGSIDYKTFDGTTLSSQTRFYTNSSGSNGADGGADIPIMYDNRQNSRMLFAFRVNGALPPTAIDPHKIYFGYITPVAPTATPTPSPTPSPTPTPAPTATPTPAHSSAGSSSSTSQSNTTCNDSKPSDPGPWLYATVPQSTTIITLYFTDGQKPYDHYTLEYGTQSGNYQYGQQSFGTVGTRTIQVQSLLPDTTYYFRVAAGNGCTVGPWSNELQGTTQKNGTSGTLQILTNSVSAQTPASQPTDTPMLTETTTPAVSETPTITPQPQTYNVTVTILDTKKQPVSHAKVTIHSQEQTVYTDTNGKATFQNIEKGQHSLLIAYNNKVGSETIDVSGQAKQINVTVSIQESSPQYQNLLLGVGIGVFLTICAIAAVRKAKKKTTQTKNGFNTAISS